MWSLTLASVCFLCIAAGGEIRQAGERDTHTDREREIQADRLRERGQTEKALHTT